MAVVSVAEAQEVGFLFVKEFFTAQYHTTAKLHCFYGVESTLSVGTEASASTTAAGEAALSCGVDEIQVKIADMRSQLSECKVVVSDVDCQPSGNNGILVQVVGKIATRPGDNIYRRFVRTFFLSQQPSGYFVLNDIYKFLASPSTAASAPTSSISSTNVTAAATENALPNGKLSSPRKEFPTKTQNAVANVTPASSVAPSTTTPTSTAASTTAMVPATSSAEKVQKTDKKDTHQRKDGKPATTAKKVEQAATPAAGPPQKRTWASLAGATPNVPTGSIAPVTPSSTPLPSVASAPSTKNTQEPKKKPVSAPANADSEPSKDSRSVYIRGIQEPVTREALMEVFGQFGAVKQVDMLTSKNIAFVEFVSINSVSKAIGQQVTVAGVQLVGEERKKKPANALGTSKPRRPANNNNNNANNTNASTNNNNNNADRIKRSM